MNVSFKDAAREHTSILARSEKKVLWWLAGRMPAWLNSDHLTAAGFVSIAAAAALYPLTRQMPGLLHLVNMMLFANWFGDSLDGTLARYRNRLRPRYGFYVDHIADTVGIALLIAGLTSAGYMALNVGLAFLVAYFMLAIHVYLATYTIGTFQMSFLRMGPTELRILLAAGNMALWNNPDVTVPGTEWKLFDVGAAVGTGALLAMLAAGVPKSVRTLYDAERLP